PWPPRADRARRGPGGPCSRRGPLEPSTMDWSGVDQALADGVEGRLRAVVDVELLVHVADVVANGLLADAQRVRDLLVGHAAGQELQDLQLPGRQPIVELLGRGAAGQHLQD